MAGGVTYRLYAQSPPGAYAATRITRTSLPTGRKRERCRGGRDCEPGPAAAVAAAGASRAGPRRGGCLPGAGPRRQGGALSVLRRVPVDRRRERALFDDVGVHAFQCLAERPQKALRQGPEEP